MLLQAKPPSRYFLLTCIPTRNSTGMGVVRHEVNKSTSSFEFIVNNSLGAEDRHRTIIPRVHFVAKDLINSRCVVSYRTKIDITVCFCKLN